MLAGAVASIAAQAAIVWVVMGSGAFTGFYAFVPQIIANANALEHVAQRVHSIRSITRLLPHPLETPVWIAAVAAILVAVAIVWRSQVPVRVRLGFAMLAGVLTSPHLIVYDATLLALPLVWLGAWAKTQANAKEYALAVGLLFVALALPWSSLTRIQPSVVVMLWIAHQVWRSVRRIPDVPTGVLEQSRGM